MSTVTNYEDVSVFTPEGKVKALDYVRNTVELGNTTIALSNGEVGVIIAHTGPTSALAFQTKKIFKISNTAVFAFSGMTNDGLVIVEHLLDKVAWNDIYKDQPISPLRMFDDLSVDASIRTSTSEKRLYGVGGVLMVKNNGVKLVEFEPTGIVQIVNAMSIGSRSQSAKTILENYVDDFGTMDKEALVRVGMEALRNAHPDEELSRNNVDIWCLEDRIEILDAQDFI